MSKGNARVSFVFPSSQFFANIHGTLHPAHGDEMDGWEATERAHHETRVNSLLAATGGPGDGAVRLLAWGADAGCWAGGDRQDLG
jgi:hypothetical protein